MCRSVPVLNRFPLITTSLSRQTFYHQIQIINRNYQTIRNNSLSDKFTIQIWNLTNNIIVLVERNAFRGVLGLKEAWLAINRLHDMRFICVPEMVNLTKLILSKNLIDKVPPNIFNFTHNLETLMLNQNELVQLEAYTFSKLANLTYLDLSELKIKLNF